MRAIEDFIDDLPDDNERRISRQLRTLILDAEPRITEKLSYGVPYFLRYRRLFFLWPASQSGLKHPNRPSPKVTLGFCYGNLLSNAQGILMQDGRKQVYITEFSSPADINEKQLAEIITEAIAVDQHFFGKTPA